MGAGSPSLATTMPVVPEPTTITSLALLLGLSLNALKIQCPPRGLPKRLRNGANGDRNSSPGTPGTWAVGWPAMFE